MAEFFLLPLLLRALILSTFVFRLPMATHHHPHPPRPPPPHQLLMDSEGAGGLELFLAVLGCPTRNFFNN